jgi:excisionase family DNA binding protein
VSDIDHPDPLSRGSNAPGGPPTPGAASLLDVRCVAQRLGLSTKAVRGLIARGELPAYKVAGRIRIDAADLDGYLAAVRVRPSLHDIGAPRPAPTTRGAANGLRPLLRRDDAAA